MSDLSYRKGDLFTTFYANTPEGEAAWNQLAKSTDGTGKVFTVQLDQCLQALRKAGYTVSVEKETALSIDNVLSELESL